MNTQKLIDAIKAKRARHDPIVLAVVQSMRKLVADGPIDDIQDAYFVDRAYEDAEETIELALSEAYLRGAEAMREAAMDAVRTGIGCVHARCWSCPESTDKIRNLDVPEDA